MNKWERLTHFKWTLILLSGGLAVTVGDWLFMMEFSLFRTFLFLVVIPVPAFAREIRNYDFHSAMERRGADWRVVK